MAESLYVLETVGDVLSFERETGRLVSFRSKAAPDQEFIASAADHPVFVLQYLDERRQYRQLDSHEAESARITCERGAGAAILTMGFRRVGGLDLDVTATVRASRQEPLSRWSVSLRNGAGVEVVDVQFPFIVAGYDLGGAPGSGAILWPFLFGLLIRDPRPHKLAPDHQLTWRITPSNGDCNHYPGGQFAQFLAYYNDRAGLYLACEDAAGNVKLIKPLHRDPGIRLGIAHVGDWPARGKRTLEYDVVVGSFTGEWHAAAEMYRGWSLKQKWATPLHRRTDVPDWLLDSPVHVTLRMQGELDLGPVFPVEEFLPYEKAIPLLEGIADRVRAPLVAVIMSWERAGPWVYPDCFPPVGGEASVARFAAMARQRGWHVGSFCNGTRWVTGHFWNRYDGRAYFDARDGRAGVCRAHAGEMWTERWDSAWRPSYTCCLGAGPTRRIAVDFVRTLIGWGLESVQFFDQNVNASTFPCFAPDHEHPPVPGKWMAEKMAQVVEEFRQAARDAGEGDVIQSAEQPCNEYCLPLFQQCDVRLTPPGHAGGVGGFVPVYHYLYHECIIMHGMMGFGPEPHHLPIRNAYNCVLGEIPGAVMTGDGTLLNKDTINWAPWEPKVGDNDDALEVIRTTTAMRRGPGRDFLVYGRMLPPARVENIRTITWQGDGRVHRIPAVFHAAWQAPDGRFGLVLANWTTRRRKVSVQEPRLGSEALRHACGKRLTRTKLPSAAGCLEVTIPPLGCVLLESKR
ncbi:MAG TPA: DUF6259 domain-containing protein [Phycisphaerae bacterium]|nr:DUF6259 domain-containing protein [Phycisphaerae bacterium]